MFSQIWSSDLDFRCTCVRVGARLILHGVPKEVHSIRVPVHNEVPEVVHEEVGVVICSLQLKESYSRTNVQRLLSSMCVHQHPRRCIVR
jgi:hypothetical protein